MDWSKMGIPGTPHTHSTFSSSTTTTTRRRGVGSNNASVFVVLLAIFGFLIDGAGEGSFIL